MEKDRILSIIHQVISEFHPWVNELDPESPKPDVGNARRHLLILYEFLANSMVSEAFLTGSQKLMKDLDVREVKILPPCLQWIFRMVYPTVLCTLQTFRETPIRKRELADSPKQLKRSVTRTVSSSHLQEIEEFVRSILELPAVFSFLKGSQGSSASSSEEATEASFHSAMGSPVARSWPTPRLTRYDSAALLFDSDTWAPDNAGLFQVRSADYLKTRQKQPSESCLLKIFHVDVVSLKEGESRKFIGQSEIPSLVRARARGSFLFIIRFLMVDIQVYMVAECPKDASFLQSDSPSRRLWQSFLNSSEDDQKKRIKLIPQCVKGSWLVKRTMNDRPVLLCTKMPTSIQHVPNQFIEVTLEMNSSTYMFNLLKSQCGQMSIRLGVLIEGTCQDFLPERLLFALTFHRPTLPAL